MPQIGSEIAGYRLDSLISRGGMGVVYIAEDVRMGRKVALKLLAADLVDEERFRERFLRESRTAAGIDHPNVIPIYDAGDADGLLFIAMRYVDGPDLRLMLRQEGPLELSRAVSIATQAASALSAAHARGLVHRDVKPANILMMPRGPTETTDHIYLTDFGLAKHTSSVSGLTATGQFLGSVSYIAPEQAEGKHVDGRTDVYGLGCVLFECIAGQPPFRKEGDVATVMAHLRDAAPSVTEFRRDCPIPLAEVVAKTLEKAPDDRYQSCEELIAALGKAAKSIADEPVSRTISSPVISAIDDSRDSEADTGRVAAGAADVPEPVTAEPVQAGSPSTAPADGGSRRWLAFAIGSAVALGAGGGLAVLLAGGDDKGKPETTLSSSATSGGAATTTEAPAKAGTGTWRELRRMPLARQQLAAAAASGRIWLVGGLTGETTVQATRESTAYDPAINTFTEGPHLPIPLHHASAVTRAGEVVVLGGWIPDGPNLTAVASDRVFALRGGRWVALPRLHHARAAAAAATVGDKIIVVGGQAGGELVKQTEIFDGKEWKDAAPLPTPREHLAAASDGRYLYAAGGRELAADHNKDALERFDPANGSWTKLPPMPTPSGSVGAAIVGHTLVVVGGEDPTSVIPAVQAYNLRSQKWYELAGTRVARHGAGVVALGRTLYVLGGATAPTHAESTDEAEALDFH
jgi:non-specific serine/threonine protein kinase